MSLVSSEDDVVGVSDGNLSPCLISKAVRNLTAQRRRQRVYQARKRAEAKQLEMSYLALQAECAGLKAELSVMRHAVGTECANCVSLEQSLFLAEDKVQSLEAELASRPEKRILRPRK
jgi:hypothetical protein